MEEPEKEYITLYRFNDEFDEEFKSALPSCGKEDYKGKFFFEITEKTNDEEYAIKVFHPQDDGSFSSYGPQSYIKKQPLRLTPELRQNFEIFTVQKSRLRAPE